MTFSTTNRRTLIGIILLIAVQFALASDFPRITDQAAFESDLKRTALINHLPNLKGDDYYLGLKVSTSGLNTAGGQFVLVPEARVSIYPNPGYNVWAHFAKWPAETPSFSYGTGAQVVFFGDNGQSEQALGFSWSMIVGEVYRQRDITLYGLYSRVYQEVDYGLILHLDLHHVIVKKKIAPSSYDGTIVAIAPYIKLMKWNEYSLSVLMPISANGVGVSLGIERSFGMRE